MVSVGFAVCWLEARQQPLACYTIQFNYLEILITRGRPAHRLCYADPSQTISSYSRLVEDPEGTE